MAALTFVIGLLMRPKKPRQVSKTSGRDSYEKRKIDV